LDCKEAYFSLGAPLVSSRGGDSDIRMRVAVVGAGAGIGVERDSMVFLFFEASFFCRWQR
jgi:hypothetical protein